MRMNEPTLIAPGISMSWEIMSGAPCIAGTRIAQGASR